MSFFFLPQRQNQDNRESIHDAHPCDNTSTVPSSSITITASTRSTIIMSLSSMIQVGVQSFQDLGAEFIASVFLGTQTGKSSIICGVNEHSVTTPDPASSSLQTLLYLQSPWSVLVQNKTISDNNECAGTDWVGTCCTISSIIIISISFFLFPNYVLSRMTLNLCFCFFTFPLHFSFCYSHFLVGCINSLYFLVDEMADLGTVGQCQDEGRRQALDRRRMPSLQPNMYIAFIFFRFGIFRRPSVVRPAVVIRSVPMGLRAQRRIRSRPHRCRI